MAEQLVSTMAGEFEPEKDSDKYKDNLMEIINAKLKGKKIEVEEPEEKEATNVVDLMARLQESLAKGKKKADKKADMDADTEADMEADTKSVKAKPKKKRKTA
jgi:DNA end-binding protein Ku